MRLMNLVADRLLSAVVPRITAGACCAGDPFWKTCFCEDGVWFHKSCHYNCSCGVVCGDCTDTVYTC